MFYEFAYVAKKTTPTLNGKLSVLGSEISYAVTSYIASTMSTKKLREIDPKPTPNIFRFPLYRSMLSRTNSHLRAAFHVAVIAISGRITCLIPNSMQSWEEQWQTFGSVLPPSDAAAHKIVLQYMDRVTQEYKPSPEAKKNRTFDFSYLNGSWTFPFGFSSYV